MKLSKYDYSFLIVLCGSLVFRILLFNYFPKHNDTITYIISAKGIINNEYQSSRMPGFPLTIIPLILINNGWSLLPARLAANIEGLLLIIASYFVFTKAYQNLYNLDDIKKENAKFIGLLVSFLISMNSFLAAHSSKGLREDLIALILVLFFYFAIVKKEMRIRDNIYLAFLVSYLTLTHLSAGLFTIIGIFLFFSLSKLKMFKYENISLKRFFIIICSFGLTFFLWALFNAIKGGNPFINWKSQRFYFKNVRGIDLSSFDNMITALTKGLTRGVPIIFFYLITLLGYTFALLIFYMFIKNIKKPQLFFLFLIIIFNYAYISIFIVPGGTEDFPICPRLISYYFPFLFYIGSSHLGNICLKSKKKKNITFYNQTLLLILYFSTYIVRNIIFLYSLKKVEYFILIEDLLLYVLFGFTLFLRIEFFIIFVVNEISLLVFLILNRNIERNREK